MNKLAVTIVVIASLACATPVLAGTGIDFTAPLMQLDGKPAIDCKILAPDGKSCAKSGPMTLGEISAGALSKPDRDATLEIQVRKGMLAQKVIDAKSASLTTEEISMIKNEIAKLGLSTVLVADAIGKLDPAMVKK